MIPKITTACIHNVKNTKAIYYITIQFSKKKLLPIQKRFRIQLRCKIYYSQTKYLNQLVKYKIQPICAALANRADAYSRSFIIDFKIYI